MVWSEKIDNKKYAFGTLIGLLFAGYAAKWATTDSVLLCSVVAASALNQWLMFLIFGAAFQRVSGAATEEKGYFKLVSKMVLKLGLLLGVFYVLIKLGRHLVLHGVILYTFQLIILVMSIKNVGVFPKKGSSE